MKIMINLMEQLMKAMGGGWSCMCIINEHNIYSIWCKNKTLIYWPKVGKFEILRGNVIESTYCCRRKWTYEIYFWFANDLDGLNPTFEVHNYGNKTQVPFSLANLLSLLHLLISKTKEKNC
jgi:hypothetical protein